MTNNTMDRQHFNKLTIIVVCAISLSSLSYGYSAAVIGTISGQPSFYKYMKLEHANNAASILGAMNALYYVGGVFGTFYASYAADRWGRRNASIQAQVLLAITQALQAGSVHVAMFIVGRFLCGFAGYMVLCVTPMWLSEIVPPKQRGTFVEISIVLLILGYFTASWAGYGFFFYNGSVPAFRPLLAVGCFVPVVFVGLSPWMPESPRWLIFKDRHEEALKLLKRLHQTPGDSNDTFAKAEFYQITKQAELDAATDLSDKSFFSTRTMRKRTFLGILWPFMTATSGILVIFNYGPLLYAGLGYSPEKQVLFQGGWITLNWAANIAGCLLVDKFKRTTFGAVGLTACVVCMIVEAAVVAVSRHSPNTAVLQTGVAMIFLYGVAYGSTLDGLLFVWVGEFFPNTHRAKGFNIALATQALANIAWTGAAPTAFENIGWHYYLIFIIFSSIHVVVILLVFPNTRFLALEEIAALFGDAEHVAVYQGEIDETMIVEGVAAKESEIIVEHTENMDSKQG